jgi:hypothetical protein
MASSDFCDARDYIKVRDSVSGKMKLTYEST